MGTASVQSPTLAQSCGLSGLPQASAPITPNSIILRPFSSQLSCVLKCSPLPFVFGGGGVEGQDYQQLFSRLTLQCA